MKLQPGMLELDAHVAGLLINNPRFVTFCHQATARHPAIPTLLAVRKTTRQVLAVYVRPRRLAPSEQPPTNLLPDGAVSVVWTPQNLADARRWIQAPLIDPPGLLVGTWQADR